MTKPLDAPKEQHRTVAEEEFWRRHEHQCGSHSEYKPLFKDILLRVRAVADADRLDALGFEEKLKEAELIVVEVTDALRAFWKDPPDGVFFGWGEIQPSDLMERPEKWSDASPISQSRLDAATARYLDRPWLQSNRLDWYLMKGFMLDEMLRSLEGVKSGAALGTTDLAYAFSGGRYWSGVRWRLGLSTAKFIAGWLLLPVLAAIAYYFDYTTAAQLTLGIFGVLVIFRIGSFPSRFMAARARRRQITGFNDRFARLLHIYLSMNAFTLNPTVLCERLKEAEKGTVLVHSPVYSILVPYAVYCILDRAIARDAAVFLRNPFHV